MEAWIPEPVWKLGRRDKPLILPGFDPRFSCRPLKQEIQTKTFVRISCISSWQGNNHPGYIRLRVHTLKFLYTYIFRPFPSRTRFQHTAQLAWQMWQSSPVVSCKNNPQSTNKAGMEILYQHIFPRVSGLVLYWSHHLPIVNFHQCHRPEVTSAVIHFGLQFNIYARQVANCDTVPTQTLIYSPGITCKPQVLSTFMYILQAQNLPK